MGAWTLEECTLRADHEHKFYSAMRLDFTQLCDQFNNVTPVNVVGKATGYETLKKQFVFVIEMRFHPSSFVVGMTCNVLNRACTSRPQLALRLESKLPRSRTGDSG